MSTLPINDYLNLNTSINNNAGTTINDNEDPLVNILRKFGEMIIELIELKLIIDSMILLDSKLVGRIEIIQEILEMMVIEIFLVMKFLEIVDVEVDGVLESKQIID